MAKKYLDKSGLTYLVEQLDKRYQGGSGGRGFTTTLLDYDAPHAGSGDGVVCNIGDDDYMAYDWLIFEVIAGAGYTVSQLVSKHSLLQNVGAIPVGSAVIIIEQGGTYLHMWNDGTPIYEYWIYGVNK